MIERAMSSDGTTGNKILDHSERRGRGKQCIRGQRSATLASTLGVLAAIALVSPSAASAEPDARNSTWTNCPTFAATCTQYWSVDRTKEFNDEEKAWVLGEYAAGAGAAAVAAAAASSTVIGAPVGVAAAAGGMYNGYKAAEFDVQISSAANDKRCLIYKFPKGAMATGWWGSVNPNTNEHCQEANERDQGLFG